MNSTTIRPFNLHSDMEAMTNLIEIAFAGELATWGGDYREQVRMARQTIPIISFLSFFSKAFQHVFDGFVCEDKGQIVSMVNVHKTGFDTKRWNIGNVATHPDYQRRGLARQLVTRALEHARALGAEICTLDVRTAAIPAYNLYRSLGFVHFDSTTTLKLENFSNQQALPIPANYTLRVMQLGEWQPRYQLALRETPEEVQAFLPIRKIDFQIFPIEHLTNRLAEKIQQIKIFRWGVEKDGELVATLSIVAQIKSKVHHKLSVHILPSCQSELTGPLLSLALATLQAYPQNMLRVEIRNMYSEQLAVFQRFGFLEIESNHRLGLKFR